MKLSLAFVLLSALMGALATLRTAPNIPDIPIGRASLCVTEGSIDEGPGGRLSVHVPSMRAFVTIPTSQRIAMHFKYLGSTAEEARLESGDSRHQIGLKLRAQDGCNVIYVMWRIAHTSTLVVSVKSNPDMHESAACGNRGYTNIKPSRTSPLPALQPGDTHTLRAELSGQVMRVSVDDAIVWEGEMGSQALAITGPVGLRSDNVRFELDLLTAPPDSTQRPLDLSCRSGIRDA